MSSRWFRIAYARNAFLRVLGELEVDLQSLSLADGARAMEVFFREHRPQHGERDELDATWSPAEGGYEFAIVRRMQRHGQPEAYLSLVFTYRARADLTATGRESVSTARDVQRCARDVGLTGARPILRRLDQS
ncbi:hypothetical protein [Schumannella luteola]